MPSWPRPGSLIARRFGSMPITEPEEVHLQALLDAHGDAEQPAQGHLQAGAAGRACGQLPAQEILADGGRAAGSGARPGTSRPIQATKVLELGPGQVR